MASSPRSRAILSRSGAAPALALLAAVLVGPAAAFHYIPLAAMPDDQAHAPQPGGKPATDGLEAFDRTGWRRKTLDEWRSCGKWKAQARTDPDNVKVAEIMDRDGNAWTEVSWRWTVVGSSPPITGFKPYLCAADRLLDIVPYGPLARFYLSDDRSDLALWAGPMDPASGYGPKDMFYWRLRAADLDKPGFDARLFLSDSRAGAWLTAWVTEKEPWVMLDLRPREGLGASAVEMALYLIEREGLLGKDSPYADPSLVRALRALGRAKIAKGDGYVHMQLSRGEFFLNNHDGERINLSVPDLKPK